MVLQALTGRGTVLRAVTSTLICIAALSGCADERTVVPGPTALDPIARDQSRAKTHASPTYQVLYNFGAYPDAEYPAAGLTNVGGTLYGTTSGGGAYSGNGTVYSITTSGAETVVYSFKGPFASYNDGANPYSDLIDVNGALFGTTEFGGPPGDTGTLFAVTPSGTETQLAAFPDGLGPTAGVIDMKGTLYGTTFGPYGTVYSATTTGKVNTLHQFAGGSDGAVPFAGLVDVNGTLYGTTEFGGSKNCHQSGNTGCGTVYSITAGGQEKIIHTFAGGSDGAFPIGGLVNVNGTLYGTTANGGTIGYGTIYSITTAGTKKVLHNFAGRYAYGEDGASPRAGLVDVNGTLYGTAYAGGLWGHGILYSITRTGGYHILHHFTCDGGTDGGYPQARLLYLAGTLYGTTYGCGTNGYGIVFALSL